MHENSPTTEIDWSLERADKRDLERLLDMVAAFHEFESITLPDHVRREAVTRMLDDQSLGGIWLILADTAVAGYIALCRGFSIEFGGYDAFIDELFLRPEYRGKGGGRFALDGIQNIAGTLEIKALHLEVAKNNERAQGLYRSCGFRERSKYLLMSTG